MDREGGDLLYKASHRGCFKDWVIHRHHTLLRFELQSCTRPPLLCTLGINPFFDQDRCVRSCSANPQIHARSALPCSWAVPPITYPVEYSRPGQGKSSCWKGVIAMRRRGVHKQL